MVGYLVFLTISAGLFGIFALGLNLQWGFTGLINFGHVAFMTVGAYATVLLTSQG
ncbi:MAG: branched-chain amino acid ABC transporter permease, partial [Prochloraceae cyanobacterium]